MKPDNILRLKYRLEPKDNDVVEFQIFKQCKRIKYNYGHDPIGVFNGWEVRSSVFPAVYTER